MQEADLSSPRRSFRSVATSSQPGRESLPAPFLVALIPAAAGPVPLHGLPSVAAVAAHRVLPWPAPAVLPCTSLWCDKSSLRGPENRLPEPAPPHSTP